MSWQDNIASNFGWVQDWQTLLGALLATAAAIATVLVMHSQTQQARKRDAHAMERKSFAARARMPDALRDMNDYCHAGATKILRNDKVLPNEPLKALEELKIAIEFIDTEKAEQLFDLLSHYQVYTSRFPDFKTFSPGQGIYDSAKLNYYINRLYGYARNREDEVEGESENERIKNSMKTLVSVKDKVTYEKDFDAARKLVDAYHP
ncbi:hypothetical protein ACM25O_14405 [Sulfitobacter pontiacus]